MNKELVSMTFDAQIARKFDTDTAIILHNIQFWINLNQKNNENFIDGKYWTFNSAGKFTEVFEWLSEKQIRTRLNKLIKAGYLEEGNFNKRGGDKTKWYSLTNRSDQMVTCTDQMGTCSSQMVSDTDQMGTATSQMGRPLPDINKDINKDINTDVYVQEKKEKKKLKNKSIDDLDVTEKEILDYYNALFRPNRPSKDVSWKNNLNFWLKDYSVEDIKEALTNLSKYDHWSKKNGVPTLTLIFRTRNTNGEANYIDQLLALGETTQQSNKSKYDIEFDRLFEEAL